MKLPTKAMALAGVLLTSVFLAGPADAQADPELEAPAEHGEAPAEAPVDPGVEVDTLALAGAVEGTTSATAAGTSVWTLSGFAGGLTLGPIGAGLAFAVAESSASALPADVQSKVGRRGSEFSLAYQQAYTRKLIARRRRATLIGGAAGTALLVVGTVGMYLRLQ